MDSPPANTESVPGADSADNDGDDLLAQLTCPGCGYQLRGAIAAARATEVEANDDATRLLGAAPLMVRCPECGRRSDAIALAQEVRDTPWYEAPFRTGLAMPVLVSVMLLFILPAAMFTVASIDSLAALTLAGFLLTWLGSLVWVARRYGSPIAIWLSLVFHVVIYGYVALFIALVVSVVGTLVAVTHGEIVWMLWGLGGCAATAGAFMIVRAIDKYVGRCCLAGMLRRGDYTDPP